MNIESKIVEGLILGISIAIGMLTAAFGFELIKRHARQRKANGGNNRSEQLTKETTREKFIDQNDTPNGCGKQHNTN